MEEKMIFSVSAVSFIVMALVLILSLVLPVFMFLFCKKKFNASAKAFFTGCGVFLIFALILKTIFQSLLFFIPAVTAKVLQSSVLMAMIGGIFAGVFEEMGRFTAFKTILKKNKDCDETALMYGAGHGGFEVVAIVSVAMITNIFFGILLNTDNAAPLIEKGGYAQGVVYYNLFKTLAETKPYMYLLSMVERIFAVIIHISLSVIVWFGAKDAKKWFFVPLAVVIHGFVDFIVGLLQNKIPVWSMELILLAFAILICCLALFVWKKNHKISVSAEEVVPEKTE